MTNYKKEIAKEKIRHEKKLKKLQKEFEHSNERKYDTENVKQAFKLGFDVNQVAKTFKISVREARNVQRRIADNKRKRTGIARSYNKPITPLRDLQRLQGSPEWIDYIRQGHQGDRTRTLTPTCQLIHDEEKICPFCYDSPKFENNGEGCIKYLAWNKVRRYVENLDQIDHAKKVNDNKKYMENKSAIRTNHTEVIKQKEPSEELVGVTVNGHPLTDDEIEVLGADEAETKEDANTLLAEDELIQRSENNGLLTKIKNKIQNPHHSAINRRRNSKALEKKASELDSATLLRLANIKAAEESRVKGKEDDQ